MLVQEEYCTYLCTHPTLLFFYFSPQFVCCMSGMKAVRGVSLCLAPCCPGYREQVESPPLLAPVVSCKRDAEWRPRTEVPKIVQRILEKQQQQQQQSSAGNHRVPLYYN